MNRFLAMTLSLGIAAASFSIQAADDSHAAHHLGGAASAPISTSMGMGSPDMARMDTQMRAMGAMHDRMMAAKTPEERSALMTEQMTTMQEGMTMMNGMSPMGGMKGGMATQRGMMEKRMEMMQSMMQMMLDRMPAPTKN